MPIPDPGTPKPHASSPGTSNPGTSNPGTSNPRTPNLRARLRRWLLTGLLAIAGAAALVWVLDFAVFQIRVAAKWNAYGSYTVDHYYAIPQKSGKTELIFDPPAPQTCVNALFPHQGWQPCWFLKGHTDQRTDE